MKRAIATSRCEVEGKLYLPGDDMTVTDEQMDALKSLNAATEIVMHAVSPNPTAHATIEDMEAAMATSKFGKTFKGNVK